MELQPSTGPGYGRPRSYSRGVGDVGSTVAVAQWQSYFVCCS